MSLDRFVAIVIDRLRFLALPLVVLTNIEPASALDPFSVIMIPDTQYESDEPRILTAMTDWMVANKEAENIAFVSHVGDLVEWSPINSSRSDDRWENIIDTMYRLDGHLPYSAVCGNHDYDDKDGGSSGNKNGDASVYLNHFGPAKFSGRSWYRGSDTDGLKAYQIFQTGDQQILHLGMAYPVDRDGFSEAVAYGESVLDAHPNLPVIITTHYYLNGRGRYDSDETGHSEFGDLVWENLISNRDQVFMVLCGHTGPANHRLLRNNNGRPVMEIMRGKSDGYFYNIRFDTVGNEVRCAFYSPYEDETESGRDGEFTFDVDIENRFQLGDRPTTNRAPVVQAGVDLTVTLPESVSLRGSITDDGLPGPIIDVNWVPDSGPGEVQLSEMDSVETNATFTEPGLYTIRLTAHDGELTAEDEVQVTVNPPAILPPVVNAGPDQTIPFNQSATLEAEVNVSVFSTRIITYEWSPVSGPGNVLFSEKIATTTSASFEEPGTYRLRMTVRDGVNQVTDDMTVTVLPPPNEPPTIHAGSDVALVFPGTVTLEAETTDDDYSPRDSLRLTWRKKEGPGSVEFSASSQATTQATFSQAGVYRLEVSAFDGEFTVVDEVVVTLTRVNLSPQIDAGRSQQIADISQAATLAAQIVDDNFPGADLTVEWTQIEGPPATIEQPTEALTQVQFTAGGVHRFRLRVSDGEFTLTDEVRLEVNEAPRISMETTLPDVVLPAALTLTAEVTDDPDQEIDLRWTLVDGPAPVTFSDSRSETTDLSLPKTGTYTIRLTASDGLTSTTTDVIVRAINEAPVITLVSPPEAEFALPVGVGIVLDATVVDDGLPATGQLSSSWHFLGGPDRSDLIMDENEDSTAHVQFDGEGVYRFRLEASDGAATSEKEIAITVTSSSGGGFREEDGSIMIEASDFSDSVAGSNPEFEEVRWKIVEDLPSPGDRSVSTPEAAGKANRHGDGPILSYPIDFSNPGRYQIWAFGYGADGSQNSVFASLNGTSDDINLPTGSTPWDWKKGPRVTIDSPGTYVLELSMREGGGQIKSVFLTQNGDEPSDEEAISVKVGGGVYPGADDQGATKGAATVLRGHLVDSAGQILPTPSGTSFSWTQRAGEAVTIGNALARDTAITAVEDGLYEFRFETNLGGLRLFRGILLTVSDLAGWAYENGVTDLSADDDQDRLSNLYEFAFGTDPQVSDDGHECLPVISNNENGTSSLRFGMPALGREGILYRAQVSYESPNGPWFSLAEKSSADLPWISFGIPLTDRPAPLGKREITLDLTPITTNASVSRAFFRVVGKVKEGEVSVGN
ncbi:MAG: metallophosphoesterase [Verrucomicrobiota bacterium]